MSNGTSKNKLNRILFAKDTETRRQLNSEIKAKRKKERKEGGGGWGSRSFFMTMWTNNHFPPEGFRQNLAWCILSEKWLVTTPHSVLIFRLDVD